MARVFKTGITADSDIITGGKLQSTASAGDEGGEIFLNKSVTNTTINGGVTIDVFQNKLRFFEQGGSARGFYIDMTAGGAGVATNLASSSTTQGYGWTGFKAGYYYYAQGGSQTNATPALNTMTLVPFILSVSATFTKIGIYVNTGGVSSVVRLGIYNSTDGAPSTRLLDAGTVATTTSATFASITISQTLSPGLYWLAAVSQTATCSAQCKGSTAFVPQVPYLASPANSSMAGFQVASTTGALPDPVGTLAKATSPFEVFLQL